MCFHISFYGVFAMFYYYTITFTIFYYFKVKWANVIISRPHLHFHILISNLHFYTYVFYFISSQKDSDHRSSKCPIRSAGTCAIIAQVVLAVGAPHFSHTNFMVCSCQPDSLYTCIADSTPLPLPSKAQPVSVAKTCLTSPSPLLLKPSIIYISSYLPDIHFFYLRYPIYKM